MSAAATKIICEIVPSVRSMERLTNTEMRDTPRNVSAQIIDPLTASSSALDSRKSCGRVFLSIVPSRAKRNFVAQSAMKDTVCTAKVVGSCLKAVDVPQ